MTAPNQPQYPAQQYPAPPQYPAQQQYPVQQQYPTQQYPSPDYQSQGAPWGPPPPVPPQPQNAFGVTALVLGIIGLILSFVPIVGLLGILLGLVAVVFGILGMVRASSGRATNKPMSIAGLVLGALAVIVGIVITVLTAQAADRINRGLEELREEGRSSLDEPSPAAPTAPAAPAAGDNSDADPAPGAFEWEDGVKVEVGEATPITFSDTACCPDDPAGVAYTIRIVNDSEEEVEPFMLTMGLTADGKEVDQVFDSGQDVESPSDAIQPGEEITMKVAFAASRGDLVLEVGAFDRDSAYFSSTL